MHVGGKEFPKLDASFFSMRKDSVRKYYKLFSSTARVQVSSGGQAARSGGQAAPPQLHTHIFSCPGTIPIPASHSLCCPFTSPRAALPGMHNKASSEMIIVKPSLVSP